MVDTDYTREAAETEEATATAAETSVEATDAPDAVPETSVEATDAPSPAHRRQGRGLRYGGFSLAITLCFIAVVVLLNVVVASLGERYSLRLDLTSGQIFNLSRESIRFLSELDKDVTLYVLTAEDYFSSGNLYYIQAQEVLRQYAARSSRIKLEYVDLPKSPGFEKRFPQYQVSSYMIILESGERTSTVLINDLFNTDFDQYYYTEYITSSKAEQVLTSAIMGLTMEHQVTVAMIEGFGESGAQALENILKVNNYNPIHQSILTEEIDPEAEIAVISAPLRDYTEDELRKLDRYLQNDNEYGHSLLYLPAAAQPEMPNLNAFLADWGISVDEGIVYQTDYAKLVTMSNYWSAAEYTETVYAKPAVDRRLLSVVPEARPLSVLYDAKDRITVSAPLVFGESAVVAPLEFDEDWSPDMAERRGPIPAFVVASMTRYSAAQRKDVTSNVMVFGSFEFVGQSLLSSRTVGNAEYILNVFALASDRADTVYIAPKTIGAQELPITGNIIIILGIVFVAALPLTVLIVGGVVFFRRRHL